MDTRTTESRFEEIQRTLPAMWRSLSSLNQDEQTIVVVPSLSLDVPPSLERALPLYEERFLFLLFLLRQPRARMVFVTSREIASTVVEYYLALLPGVIPSHARSRLHLVSADDGSPKPLTRKLLSRPDLLEQIRELIPDRARAHLVPFATTDLERDLVVELGIPMYGADPRHAPLGTKTGSRRLFAETGVPHPDGAAGLRDFQDITAAIEDLLARRPDVQEVIVKHDEGVGGLGNGTVDLHGLGHPIDLAALAERIRAMRLGGGGIEEFMEGLARHGGIVEERIAADEIRSPSVQLRGTPLGTLEVLSTHDQLLGGSEGYAYEGCRFPADASYAPAITQEAVKVGKRLVEHGVIGRFAIDFVVVRGAGSRWSPYAIEVNLRKGGTTHPYLTLQFLTDGRYDAETASFITPAGHEKFFVATDYVHNPAYRGLTLDDLFDIVVRHGLHFDQSRQSGIVMHMMSGLSELGRIGLTAVGDSHAQADDLYATAKQTLDEETDSRA